MSTVEDLCIQTQPTDKPVKTQLKQYRQKLMTIKARIKNRVHAIKTFRKHLKNETFPKQMKSIKPYPKMQFSKAQATVNVACDQVHCVILDQMLLEEQKKLAEDQESYEALKVQPQGDRQQLKTPKKLRNPPWLNYSEN